MRPAVLLLLAALTCLRLSAQPLPPFGTGTTVPPRQVKANVVKPLDIACLTTADASLWNVENPPAEGRVQYAIDDEQGTGRLRFSAHTFEPNRSTLRIMLPGDGPANGDVWAKARATYVTFRCQSTKPAQLSFHLLQRGKSAGMFAARFTAHPGDWERVVLPLAEFDLKSFIKVAGLGFRVIAAEPGTEVSVRDFSVGATPYTDDTWRSQRVAISIDGEWHFAPDSGKQGEAEKWYAPAFDDQAWQVLKSGEGWQQQGVDHYGYGWYRQQLFVPKELAGVPLTLNLVPIAADDDAWFNGTRIGGINSEYKYNVYLTRSYTVPPELIHYGATNTIALRIWGGDVTFIGNKSGLVKGPLTAEFDPFGTQARSPGGVAVPAALYDFSATRQGQPFELIFPFPAEVAREAGATLRYRLADVLDNELATGQVPVTAGETGTVQAVVAVDRATAATVYLRGRFHVSLLLLDAAGMPLYAGVRDFDRLSFTQRDNTPLPALAEQHDDTPYGKLKLVDEIDCATAQLDDPHPYLQGGFDHIQDRQPPGSPVAVQVAEILGKPARSSAYGWFAYRIGRGQLKPHSTYLLRVEYPEDQPRFCPMEVQTGQNFMDVGWRNGVAADDVYDPWPLSHQWQWYDVIVPLDDQTVGTGGTGSASAANGFWVYFLNKQKPGAYYAMWAGGPAIARIRLYEIDAAQHAPAITRPAGLPQRTLCFDWERQPDCNPADLVRYAKLMGYNTISPVIIKWFFANYSDPLKGYASMLIDDHDYWVKRAYDPASGAAPTVPIPGMKSQHVRFLEATKELGLNYLPRFEWGGSEDLPKEARASDTNGQPTKPNRFAPWCANLLHPATWEDLRLLMEHLIKPYTADNPQLIGALWRIRCDRLPISYGKEDIALFAKETGTALPPGGETQWGAWAAGDMKVKYDDWWHHKRAQFHQQLVELLRSYRPDLMLYYYNWDEDKFGLIQPDITSWAFVSNVVKPAPDGGRAAYEKERQTRKALTAEDYLAVLRSGSFGTVTAAHTNRADYGLRPELYQDLHGIQLLAPANYLCYSDKPAYLNYFRTADGLSVSNCVSYDEIGARSINPKYEGNMITPGGAPFSMALELLAYFHGDARMLTYTVYTYGRGFADAHRRFAQAYLALPAIAGTVADQGDADVKLRTYPSANGTYVGVAYKGFVGKKLTLTLPGAKAGATLTNLVTGAAVPTTVVADGLQVELTVGPMELNAFLLH